MYRLFSNNNPGTVSHSSWAIDTAALTDAICKFNIFTKQEKLMLCENAERYLQNPSDSDCRKWIYDFLLEKSEEDMIFIVDKGSGYGLKETCEIIKSMARAM